MKTQPLLRSRCWAVPTLLLILAMGVPLAKAANANPPDRMTYQGFLVDVNGTPLGTNNPVNYDVVFRIYDASQGGNLLWAEQQTATIDKGYFSVLLGEGSGVGSEPRPNLPILFTGDTASDRYVGITVKKLGSTDVEIVPRLRLLTSPYAYLAQNAVALVSNGGQPLVSAATGAVGIKTATPATELDVNGTVTASAFVGNGAQVTAINAGNITSGTLNADRIPGLNADKIVAGTLNDNRLSANIARLDDPNPAFASRVKDKTGFLMPPGAVMPYAASSAPQGWLICDGSAVSRTTYADLYAVIQATYGAGDGTTTFNLPNLKGRVPFGRDTAQAEFNALSKQGGEKVHPLAESEMPPHRHYTTVANNGWPDGSGDRTPNNYLMDPSRGANANYYTSNTGSGVAHNTLPPYVVLNYIIKY